MSAIKRIPLIPELPQVLPSGRDSGQARETTYELGGYDSRYGYFPAFQTPWRYDIWDFAIRPRLPGVHFFTAYGKVDDTKSSLLSQYELRNEIGHPHHVAAPRISPSYDGNQEEQFSWTIGNRSTYLMDCGLWAACAESRAAVEQRGFPMTSYEDDKKMVRNHAVHVALDYGLISWDWDWDNPGDECAIRAAADGLYFTKNLWFGSTYTGPAPVSWQWLQIH
ncbi:hypothetical protein F5144DRAFT_594874 [Chaetomium tenue]|uniref:Uncharacterized protein n=1 Tax=Chaetomium tenue TaxID=1854479 RepID=A0ACB7NVW5_9PEZI|nr:hypothetical protein F5144DRAFT_594874 [Chaetomium globosum]